MTTLLSAAIAACAPSNSNASETSADANESTATQGSDHVTEWKEGTISPDASQPIVIDFNAVWCPPCRMFGPVYHAVAAKYAAKAKFLSVDVDSVPAAAGQFGVSSIPQISVLKPDGTVKSTIGYMSEEEFIEFLDSALN